MKTINVKDLMAISGKGGLFRFIAQARNGIVVESLEDKKRTIAPTTARVSALDDITIFTEDEDMPLADVFKLIYDKQEGKESISPKSSGEELKAFLKEILPSYDDERVYVSDIKKLLTWYNLLHKYSLLELIEKEEAASAENDDQADAETETESTKE